VCIIPSTVPLSTWERRFAIGVGHTSSHAAGQITCKASLSEYNTARSGSTSVTPCCFE
jgi:hypothetical protein